jgi:hypothetical protein
LNIDKKFSCLQGKDASTFSPHLGATIGTATGRSIPLPKADDEASLSQQCNCALLSKALDP